MQEQRMIIKYFNFLKSKTFHILYILLTSWKYFDIVCTRKTYFVIFYVEY